MKMSEEEDRSPLCKYVTKLEKVSGGGNVSFACNYCHITFVESYSRVKSHLLKIRSTGIRVCSKVTPQLLSEVKRVVCEVGLKMKAYLPNQVPLPTRGRGCVTAYSQPKKRKGSESVFEKAFNLEARQEMDSLIARMYYSVGLSFHLVRNPNFIVVITNGTANNRTLSGYIPPGID